MRDYGGDITCTLSGTPYVLTEIPSFDLDPFEKGELVNADRSVDRTLTPTAGKVGVTFRDRGENWGEVANGGPYVVSLVEPQTGASHTINRMRFGGRASVNRVTGEVTGLEMLFDARDYLRRG